MRQSHLFGTTRRSISSEETSKNAILLQRGGYVSRSQAGVYSFLPLGLRVLQNISAIVRNEMSTLPDTQELLMPALQPLALWRESERLEEYDEVMYRVLEEDIGLGPTHEEIITDLFRQNVHSYKELPLAVYQIQTKFRKELRAKSGVMRGREFLMKDLYSFHETKEDLDRYYEEAQTAYHHIFERCGLEAILTEASGGSFSTEPSHEFQVVNGAGEDTIYLNAAGTLARNKEIVPNENDSELAEFGGGMVRKIEATEVGNIFKLNQRFSKGLGATVANEAGEQVPVWMGCYGIGISRLFGVITEIFGDVESGTIRWPREVAPFQVHLLDLTADLQGAQAHLDLEAADIPVLYDDRQRPAGEKFADADLIGAPARVIVSPRSLEQGGAEVRLLPSTQTEIVPLDVLATRLKEWLY
jgi:prolyl-tRNA synthetase